MPRILIDSIEFGLPASESLHPASGEFAASHEAVQSMYGGPPHVLSGEQRVHHWRDWAGAVGIELEAPDASGLPLELTVWCRAYRNGDPDEAPAPTRLTVEAGGAVVCEAERTIEPGGEWIAWRVPLAAGVSGVLSVSFDDTANVFHDGSHYGKSFASIKLTASDEPPEAGCRVLLDALDLGLTESEVRHRPFGDLALRLPGVRNAYLGPPNLLANRDLCHFREAPRINAFQLDVPSAYLGTEVELEVAMRAYRFGEPGFAPAPTGVQAVGNERWVEIDAVDVPLDDRFHVYRFRVPAEVVETGGVLVWIDDRANHDTPESHYGKAIGYVALTGDPARAGTGAVHVAPAEPADIVLTICPVWAVDTPPVSMVALASYLDGHGLNVKVYDFNIEFYCSVTVEEHDLWEACNLSRWEDPGYSDSILERYEHAIQRAADEILAPDPRFVGFSLAGGNWGITRRLARLIRERKPDVTIVFGGPGMASHERHRLGDDWDYLIYGAGEKPLLSLVRDGDATAPGIIPRGGYEPFSPKENRAVLRDLNELPLLHFKHFNLLRYEHPWALPIITSRGCIFRCSHCFDFSFYAPYRCLDGERAVEQMRHLVRTHGRRTFHFADLLCNGNLTQLRRMAELLIEADLDVQWDSFAAFRRGMSRELTDLLARSGCAALRYGLESASPSIMKRMNKRVTLDEIRECLVNTSGSGIETRINLMVGYPGETDRTVQDTIDFVLENKDRIDFVETVCPVFIMEHTDLAHHPEKYGIDTSIKSAEEWVAGDVTFERRQQWVFQMVRALREAGIDCTYGVVRGFAEMNDKLGRVGPCAVPADKD